jgi:MFS family permease
MIRFLSKDKRQRSQAPVRTLDRVLEVAALCMAVILLICTLAFYVSSPELVADHIGLHGEADSWGPRGMFWILCFIGWFITGLLVWAAYEPSLINLPVKLRPEVLVRQHQLMGEMTRLLAIVVCLIFILTEWMMYSVSPERPQVPAPLFVVFALTVMGLLALIALYTWRIYKVKL